MIYTQNRNYNGFTIVELLVVVVVIGVLASLSLVSYTGISQRAVGVTLKSDLKNAATRLEIDKMANSIYPASESAANDGKGLPKSSGTDYQYNLIDNGYCISATSSGSSTLAYHILSTDGVIAEGVCDGDIPPPGAPVVWRQVSNGYDSSCAVATNGRLYCWGSNGAGQLGDGTTTPSSIPVAVSTSGVLSGKTVKSVAVGRNHACAIASDNNAYCWGNNTSMGMLGDGTGTNSLVPVAVYKSGVLIDKTLKSIVSGMYYTCVIASDNQAYCWGSNSSGSLGDGNGTGSDSNVPVAVDTSGVLSGKTIKSISASGGSHTCVIASDDLVYCWGYNFAGQVGNNTTDHAFSPVAVDTSGHLNGKTIKYIGVGSFHSCVIASDDLVYCWGYGSYGQIGNGSFTANNLLPVPVSTSGHLSGKTIKSVIGGYYYTCSIANDDQAYCWGTNNSGDGQLGNNSSISSNVPVAVVTSGVLSGKTLKSITTGQDHTCAIASDDQRYCWGSGAGGKLGNGSSSSSRVPVVTHSPPV